MLFQHVHIRVYIYNLHQSVYMGDRITLDIVQNNNAILSHNRKSDSFPKIWGEKKDVMTMLFSKAIVCSIS